MEGHYPQDLIQPPERWPAGAGREGDSAKGSWCSILLFHCVRVPPSTEPQK